jgi:hypothetical protein
MKLAVGNIGPGNWPRPPTFGANSVTTEFPVDEQGINNQVSVEIALKSFMTF